MKEIITIKHGPQFGGILSTVGLISTCVFAYIAYSNLRSSEHVNALLYAVCAIFSFTVFLDFRGITIDFSDGRLRQYRSFLGYKTGMWEDIENFNEIKVEWTRQHSRSTTSLITGSLRSTASDGYFVLLVGGDDFPPFEIGEYAAYNTALKMAKNLSQKLELPIIDDYKEIQDRAFERRQELEARRKRK